MPFGENNGKQGIMTAFVEVLLCIGVHKTEEKYFIYEKKKKKQKKIKNKQPMSGYYYKQRAISA